MLGDQSIIEHQSFMSRGSTCNQFSYSFIIVFLIIPVFLRLISSLPISFPSPIHPTFCVSGWCFCLSNLQSNFAGCNGRGWARISRGKKCEWKWERRAKRGGMGWQRMKCVTDLADPEQLQLPWFLPATCSECPALCTDRLDSNGGRGI